MGSEAYIGERDMEGITALRKSRVLGQSNYSTSTGFRYLDKIIDTYSGTSCDGVLEELVSFYWKSWRIRMRVLPNVDVGGPFFHRKVSITTEADVQASTDGPGRSSYSKYAGSLYPFSVWSIGQSIKNGKSEFNPLIVPDHSMSRKSLKEIGLQLMISANPTSPAYRAADALAELFADRSLMGVPLMDIFRHGLKQGTAGEYLNLQFAILPTISDAQTIADVTNRSQAIIAQFLSEAGKKTHRERRVPISVSSTTTTQNLTPLVMGDGRAFPATFVVGTGRYTTTVKTTREIWFEGEYLNLMSPKASEFEKTLKKWNAVYGYAPTIKSLWEAIPFSWMVDYFTNAQEFIQGTFMAGSDGSVPIRCYVMCKTTTRTEYTWTGGIYTAYQQWKPHVFHWVVEDETLQRESAKPYGLAWTSKDLTSKQLSILAALGIAMHKH